MDKIKAEELKAALSKTLSNEDIERKLKEEMQASKKSFESTKEDFDEELEDEFVDAENNLNGNFDKDFENSLANEKNVDEDTEDKKIKKEKTKKKKSKKNIEEESVQEKEEKYDLEDEKIEIPNIRDIEHDEEKETYNVVYIILSIAIVLLLLIIYLLFKDDIANTDKKPIINTEQTEKQTIKKIETTNTVPKESQEVILNELKVESKKETKEDPITDSKEEVLQKIEESKKEEIAKQKELKPIDTIIEKRKSVVYGSLEVSKTNDTLKQKEIRKEVKEVEPKVIIKEKTIEKNILLDKKNFKKYYNSLKYNTLKCYDFKAASIYIDNNCKRNLIKFLDDNKNAIRFEVIPVLAKDDNVIFEKMKKTLDTKDKEFVERVKEYMFRGLSRERVLETSSKIKEILGQNVILTPTNYYVKSKKNNKGVIIRAYQ